MYCGVYRIINTNREGSASSIVDCVENVPFSASVKPFTPPFTYNYICFSTILKAYLPVFIYTYCLKIVIPICVSYLVVNYLPYESLPTWIRDHTRGILWPLYWKKYSSSLSGDNTLSTLHRGGRSLGAGSTLQEDLKKEEEDPSRDLVRPNSIFKPSQTYGSIAQDICLLLTFGLCSPVLALAIAMHATLSSYHIRILITRFLYLQQSPPSPPSSPSPPSIAIHALEKSLIGISNALSLMVWPIIWSSCFFIVFLCWEISGDAVGWKKSGWVPLTILILAVILYLVTTRPTFILKVELLVQYLENRFNIHVMNPHPHPHRSPPSHDVVDSMELVNSPSFSASQF